MRNFLQKLVGQRVLAFSVIFNLFIASHLANAVVGIDEPLNITTFNIQWYGLHDGSKKNKNEHRDPHLSQFIEQYVPKNDVLVFQEIVDIKRLQSKVLKNKYKCHSYNHRNRKHQHVVLCAKPHIEFVKESDDDNYAWESVSLGGRLRPALHGVLREKNGGPIAHVLGVHLKAYPEKTSTRVKQIKLLAQRIRQLNDGLPVILLGDFNAFEQEKGPSDVEVFDEVFREAGVSIRRLKLSQKHTFRNTEYENQFDYIWVTEGLRSDGDAQVWTACKPNTGDEIGFRSIKFYNKNVSDHCPVGASLYYK